MKRTAPTLLVLLLVLAACGASGGGGGSDAPSPSAPASEEPPPSSDGGGESGNDGEIDHPQGSEAVLAITWAGGMLHESMTVTQVPPLVITGDGRVIMHGMQTLEFPGPALPALIERRLTEDGLQQVLRALEDTNLFTGDLEVRGMNGMVADANDTIFTVRAAGLESVVTVYAISMLFPDMEPPPNMSADELEVYQVLSALHDRLMTLDAWLPADAWATDTWVPYQPEAFRLYVRDVTGQPVEGGELPGQVREWPTDDDPAAFGAEIASFGDGTRCGVVEGDLGATWLAELEEANQNTLWSYGEDARYTIGARPLLPHEERVCPGVDAA
jgi:hypothetical protein